MTSEHKCFVYIVPPGATEFVTAARFQISQTRDEIPMGELIYGKRYMARADAVELDPIELTLGQLSKEEATHLVDSIVQTIRQAWDSSLRRAGVSEKDCLAIASAFIYDGFFY